MSIESRPLPALVDPFAGNRLGGQAQPGAAALNIHDHGIRLTTADPELHALLEALQAQRQCNQATNDDGAARLADTRSIGVAVGLLMADQHVDSARASALLTRLAADDGIHEAEFARAVTAAQNARADRQGPPEPRPPKRVGAQTNRCQAKLTGFPRCQLTSHQEGTSHRHVAVHADAGYQRISWNDGDTRPQPQLDRYPRRLPWALGFPLKRPAHHTNSQDRT